MHSARQHSSLSQLQLYTISDDAVDLMSITAGHFLVNENLVAVSELGDNEGRHPGAM